LAELNDVEPATTFLLIIKLEHKVVEKDVPADDVIYKLIRILLHLRLNGSGGCAFVV
jgi:hypothetical protein